MSSLLHQFIVRTIREEKALSPHEFSGVNVRGVRATSIEITGTSRQKAKIVGRIEPGSRRDAQRMIDNADISQKPRKRKTG